MPWKAREIIPSTMSRIPTSVAVFIRATSLERLIMGWKRLSRTAIPSHHP
jgi:hypothetical protein